MTWGVAEIGLAIMLLGLLGVAVLAWTSAASVAWLRRPASAVFGLIFTIGLILGLIDAVSSGQTSRAILQGAAIVLTAVAALGVFTRANSSLDSA